MIHMPHAGIKRLAVYYEASVLACQLALKMVEKTAPERADYTDVLALRGAQAEYEERRRRLLLTISELKCLQDRCDR